MIPTYNDFLGEAALPVTTDGQIPEAEYRPVVNAFMQDAKVAGLKITSVQVSGPAYYQVRMVVTGTTSAGNRLVGKLRSGGLDYEAFVGNTRVKGEKGNVLLARVEKVRLKIPAPAEIIAAESALEAMLAKLDFTIYNGYYSQSTKDAKLDPPEFDAVNCRVGVLGDSSYSAVATISLLNKTIHISVGHGNPGWGNSGSWKYFTADLRGSADFQQALKATLNPKKWEPLVAQAQGRMSAQAKDFSDYLRGKYPNGIPAWPHTPD